MKQAEAYRIFVNCTFDNEKLARWAGLLSGRN